MKSNKFLIFLFLISWWPTTSSENEKNQPNASKHLGHGKPFGNSGPFLQLDETSDISTSEFFDKYVRVKKGLVLRGGASSFPARNLWSNDDYLRDLSHGYDDYRLLVETQKKESREQNVISLTLSQFIDEYERKELYVVDEVPSFLKKDLLLPQPLQCGQAPDTLDRTMLWFSSGGTKSVTHTDDYENILCLFAGTKELIMVDYYKFKATANTIIDEPRGSYSTMDVDKVDYDMYPGIENLEYYKLKLRPGDCVYIPFKWVHQVRSYDRNIAVNYWFNFEKIFGNTSFPEECAHNKLDMSITLENYNYTSIRNDFFLNFKHYIMRQVNMGNRKINNWSELVLGSARNDSQLEKSIDEIIQEFFNIVDFDGDGHLSDEEIIELDENSIEHMAGLLNEIDDLMYSQGREETIERIDPGLDSDEYDKDEQTEEHDVEHERQEKIKTEL